MLIQFADFGVDRVSWFRKVDRYGWGLLETNLMKIFDIFRKSKASDPDDFWHKLSNEVDLDRQTFQRMSKDELRKVITKAQAAYRQGLSADRAGETSVAREFYRKAFKALPTHIEALDNYAIGLVEELNFLDAIPIFEQSAVAERSSPLPSCIY